MKDWLMNGPCEAAVPAACSRGAARRAAALAVCAALSLGACNLFGQSIAISSIVGHVFCASVSVKQHVDTVTRRLIDIDSLAKIMDCALRRGPSERFSRVGDAALFAPLRGRSRGEAGMLLLTCLQAPSALHFTYQSLGGGDFFQDMYALSASRDSTRIDFTRRFLPDAPMQQAAIEEQTALIEKMIARIKAMMEKK